MGWQRRAAPLVAVAALAAAAGAAPDDEQERKALKQAVATCDAWLRGRHPDTIYTKGTVRPRRHALREGEAAQAILRFAAAEYRKAVTGAGFRDSLEGDLPTWLGQPLGVESFQITDAVALRDAVEVSAKVRFFAGDPERADGALRVVLVKQGRRWVLPLRPPPRPWAGQRLAAVGPVASGDVLDPGGGRSALELARAAEGLAALGREGRAVVEGLGAEARLADFAILEEAAPVGEDAPGEVRATLRCGLVRLVLRAPEAKLAAFTPGQRLLVRGRLSGFEPWSVARREVEGREVPWRHLTFHLAEAELFRS